MEASLTRIVDILRACEKESESLINALNSVVVKWDAIRTSYNNYSQYLGALGEFPDLQSKLELEQLAQSDTILAELGKQLVMYEHALIQNRGTFAKAKEQFEKRPLDSPWSFPPDTKNITEKYEAAAAAIDRSAASIDAKRLALYTVNTNENSLEPEALLKFIQGWKKDIVEI